MTVLDEVLAANATYAGQFGAKGDLALPPARQFAILTCMDARLDPAKYAGLAEGDAHVIRNAGGRATDDAIRSLVISYKLLGTRTWIVVHHTNCGMELFTDQVMGDLLEDDLGTASRSTAPIGRTRTTRAAMRPDTSSSGTPFAMQAQSVIQDVRRIREHPLVPADISLFGFVYDVRTGRLDEVEGAKSLG